MPSAPLQEWLRSPGAATCQLAADPRSIAVARSVVRSHLCDWGLDKLSDDVCAAVSELVTNALRHGTPPQEPRARRAAQGAQGVNPLTLGLMRRGSAVVCAVFDPGLGVPRLSAPDPLAESGRGLHIVASLSDLWGWSRPTPAGKAVWAVFSASGGADALDETLAPDVPDPLRAHHPAGRPARGRARERSLHRALNRTLGLTGALLPPFTRSA
ncbi:ATP-binding protein [Streptomyces polyrhachis]|uniref:ATP-binding protein n=1 Tax=Streptomyces polyrhachis TaxID=1282885 RepID=A0ABW2GKS0_9ACTN